jgi:hypothetical protein
MSDAPASSTPVSDRYAAFAEEYPQQKVVPVGAVRAMEALWLENANEAARLREIVRRTRQFVAYLQDKNLADGRLIRGTGHFKYLMEVLDEEG